MGLKGTWKGDICSSNFGGSLLGQSKVCSTASYVGVARSPKLPLDSIRNFSHQTRRELWRILRPQWAEWGLTRWFNSPIKGAESLQDDGSNGVNKQTRGQPNGRSEMDSRKGRDKPISLLTSLLIALHLVHSLWWAKSGKLADCLDRIELRWISSFQMIAHMLSLSILAPKSVANYRWRRNSKSRAKPVEGLPRTDGTLLISPIELAVNSEPTNQQTLPQALNGSVQWSC